MKWRWSLVAICCALTGHVVMAECENPATPCDIGAPGDFDADGDIDSADLAILRDCVDAAASPDEPRCQGADLDGDGDIDRADMIAWQAYHTGACDCGPYLREPPGRAPAEPTETSPDLLGPLAARTRASAVIAEHVRNVYSTNLATGEFVLRVEDLRIRGRGLDLVWARTYRSRSTARSPLGYGWDFSYNIWLERAGRNLRLHDGDGRSDVYYRQPDGTYTRREFFRVITPLSDGGYRVTFSDGSQWNLAPLDGSPRAGRLTSIVDRNGNTLRFSYDAHGRLTTIHDTLDNVAHTRDVVVRYTPEGWLESVTDFTGRTVRYDYYREGETGGTPGDLRSVTSPAVTGSPAGNNFPEGKTVIYTYSAGSSHPELDHNLLTITDGAGQTWLWNEYGRGPDTAGALSFDRLVRQFWGDTARPIDITYELRSPDGEPRADLVQATVNDRAGFVQEYWFDARNRLVRIRQHTGRADPDAPTTASENRPQEPLRSYDPPYFETLIEYNADSLLTRKVYPAGNEEQFDYSTGPRRSRGNVVRHVRLPGAIGGSPEQIVTRFSYDEQGSNFVTEIIDPRGSVTNYYYDARGNRTRIHHPVRSVVEDFEYNRYGQLTAHILPDNGSRYRRRDEYRYYASGPQRGYLESRIVDATGLALTTVYEYDPLGRVVRTIDPRGNDTLRTYNELDQLVEEASPELAEAGGARHRRTYLYDAANNLIEEIVTNFDERGNPLSRPTLSTRYEYDELGRRVRELREVEPGRDVAIEHAYDAGGSRSLTRYGEATNGNQPADTLLRQYDERGLLYREIRAAGSPAQSTTQYDYDLNGNLRRIFEGLELETPRTTLFTYDGYDRRVSVVDAMGNETKYRYDSNGNPILVRREGELHDVPGSLDNVRLSESVFEYDAMNRLVRRIDSHFDPADQSPIGDGQVLTEYEYNGLSQPVRVTDDNNHMTRIVYDTAGRRSVETDPAGNTQSWSYDANGNVVAITRVDRSDTGNSDVRSTINMTYDALNRLTQRIDPLGHSQRFGYDSRGNRVLTIDERGSVTRYVYDGLDRLVTVILPSQSATFAAGQGPVVRQRWDDSSRVIARTDPNGNTTVFAYDAAGRLVEVRHADGTAEHSTYDALGNRLTHTDAAGTTIVDTYDRLGRRIARAVTPGPGVADSGNEKYVYDGLSRLVAGSDDDSAITLHYDSLSRLRRETQQIVPSGPVRTIHYAFDGNGTLNRLVYPGGRAISYTGDLLDRPEQLRDEPFGPNSGVATYAYLGPDRIERCDLGNGTRQEVRFDSDGRIVGTRHSNPRSGQILDERSYAYDSAHHLTQVQVSAGLPGESRFFGYDARGQLIESRTTSDGVLITYSLDAAGNRLAVEGGPEAGIYELDPTTPEPADAQMNQYTSVAGTPRSYDRIGNLIGQGDAKRYTYDYRHRLVEYMDLSAGVAVMFKYDVLDRRIEKNAGGFIIRYYYAGQSLIEEQSQSNITLATYAYRTLDGSEPPVQMQRGGQKYFFHVDALGSIVRVTDAAGNVVEQYRYGDYGRPAFFSSTGTPAGSSPSANPFLFRGYRYEPELGMYTVGPRLYDPLTGRFLNRAEGRVWRDDLSDWGNPYVFNGNNPLITSPR